MQKKEIFIGIDVSRDTLDVAMYGTKCHVQIANNSEGFKQFLSWLRSFGFGTEDVWIVFEHTGGYEYRLVQFCASKKITFTRVPGLQIKKSLGIQRGKNDKVDAKRIAEYGYEKREKLTPDKAVGASIERLKLLLTQRKRFVNDRKGYDATVKELQVMYQLKKSDSVVRRYVKLSATAQEKVHEIELELMEVINSDEGLKITYKLLTSIPGIGPVNAWMVIALTENFTKFSNGRKFGCYCGVVPYEHQSGKSIRFRSRISHLANKDMKATLDMAAKSVVLSDPELKAYFTRRKELGKTYRSVINEVKFKLILRMFAVVKKQQLYSKRQIESASNLEISKP